MKNSSSHTPPSDHLPLVAYWRCAQGIAWREFLRFLHQRERFIASLVRPLVWLFIFAAGFRSVLGVSIIPPYQTYVLYEEYITPGLIGMIQLFASMQTSLSLVYDREMGSMRVLLLSPVPRGYLLASKLFAGTLTSIFQVYVFLLIAWFWDVRPPSTGYIALFPALIISGLALGSLGLLLSSFIRQLENFAGIMNFIIFPMFFMSSALYPLWRIKESSVLLYHICECNPFTHMVEFIRFALYVEFNTLAFLVVCAALVVFFFLAVWGYDPSRRALLMRKA